MSAVLKSSPYLARMSVDLLWIYITLGHRVRKTRRACEKQLMIGGMSEVDARRLSACFEDLKNNITSMLRHGIADSIRPQQR